MEIKNTANRLEAHLNQMKVEQGQERVQAGKAAANQPAADSVQFKSPGLRAAVEDAAQGAPDVREDRVAAIKSKLADGTYEVDSKAIAGKMLESSRELF